MKTIVFISNTCSNDYYEKLKLIKYAEKISPSQKYFHMLIEGLSNIDDVNVECISMRSIDKTNCDLSKLNPLFEVEKDIKFHYIPVINKKIIKNINSFFQGYVYTKKIINKLSNDDVFIICDPLSYDLSLGAIFASNNINKCAIITDLPYYMAEIGKNKSVSNIKQKIRIKLMDYAINKFNSFCFLTESMNEINKHNKPHIVIEGMVPNTIDTTSIYTSNNIVLYAGGLYEKFGIINLVEAAKLVSIKKFELHLYGEGDLVNYIKKIEVDHPNIKYKGVLSLDEILKEEKKARLLINPRPTTEEFTEYSFPSKTLEYMSTGRPVLTSKLKGIPSEYFKYLYTLESETINGIKELIEYVFSLPCEEVDNKADKALEFVINKKNNRVQAKRLWKFLIENSKK